jgi:hypothetical protein
MIAVYWFSMGIVAAQNLARNAPRESSAGCSITLVFACDARCDNKVVCFPNELVSCQLAPPSRSF